MNLKERFQECWEEKYSEDNYETSLVIGTIALLEKRVDQLDYLSKSTLDLIENIKLEDANHDFSGILWSLSKKISKNIAKIGKNNLDLNITKSIFKSLTEKYTGTLLTSETVKWATENIIGFDGVGIYIKFKEMFLIIIKKGEIILINKKSKQDVKKDTEKYDLLLKQVKDEYPIPIIFDTEETQESYMTKKQNLKLAGSLF